MSGWTPYGHRNRNRRGQTRHDRAVRRVENDQSPKAWLDPESFYKTYKTPPSPPAPKREDDHA